MDKVKKKKITVNVRETTQKDLSDFCDKSGWSKSSFADIAIQEKLEREMRGV